MPEVPEKSMRTIHGKVAIPIRVETDSSGRVTDAKLASAASSRYFAGFALKAAREWKFAPTGAAQTWILRFEFTREGAKVFPVRANP